jgi:hypothetical protein
MATTPTRSPWTADDLLAAVRQLPPAELREFQQQFAAWSEGNHEADRIAFAKGDEETLLAVIHENSTLPGAKQRRFNRLRRKQQTGTLSTLEQQTLQSLWRDVEQMNIVRLEALGQLARRRRIDVRTLMRDLGLTENSNAV